MIYLQVVWKFALFEEVLAHGDDKIVVMDDGRVAEQGIHDELLQKGGLYAKLWNIQQQSSGWTLR